MIHVCVVIRAKRNALHLIILSSDKKTTTTRKLVDYINKTSLTWSVPRIY